MIHFASAFLMIALAICAAAADVAVPTKLRIPPRAPNTPANLIDLTNFYNAALVGSWHTGGNLPDDLKAYPNDLSELTSGVVTLAGTPFDVRGVIQLSGQAFEKSGSTFPRAVEGIPVGRKFSQIHFLHSTGYPANHRARIGHYVIYYAEGPNQWIPIAFGEDVTDWWVVVLPDKPLSRNLMVAWRGDNALTRAITNKSHQEFDLHLYKSTWRNPRPATEIKSIDFVSDMTNSAPFLIAITAQ